MFNNVVAPADFVDWAKMSSAFEAMAAVTPITVDLTGSGEPVRLVAGAVSTPFFDVLRVVPRIGRAFRPEEGRVGQHRVALLNHGLWERRFGSDPSMVGKKITLNGIPHDVIGVLPRQPGAARRPFADRGRYPTRLRSRTLWARWRGR